MGEIIKHDQGTGIVELIKSNKDGLALPFTNEIHLLKTKVAGTTHVENIKEISQKLFEGSLLTFYRETKNEYDNNAIAIHTQDNNKIGYVPKDKNDIISKLLDGGKNIYAKISDMEWKGNWLKINIDVYLKD